MDEAEEIVNSAMRRYLEDAEFRARAYAAVIVLDAAQRGDTGEPMNDIEKLIVVSGAALALELDDRRTAEKLDT